MKITTKKDVKCKRCKYSWCPHKQHPKQCPACKSYRWKTPKKKKT